MAKYEVIFSSEQESEEVFRLEIEASLRTEMLYNILTEDWYQTGHFTITEEDLEEILLNFFGLISGGAFWSDNEDQEYKKSVFRLKELSNLNLNIREFLDDSQKEITTIEILDTFCSSINDYFSYEAGGSDEFTYEIEEI